MTATQTIEGQWVIRRYGDTSSEPYVGPGTHEQILPIVQAWNRHVDHLKATQRNCAETGFYMERAEPQSASEHARSVCQPTDHQPKAERARSAKPGTHVQRAIVAYRNRAVLTVERYLASVGASTDLIRRYRSAFGRKAAAAHRAATSAEPAQSGWAVARRRIVAVFAYDRALLDNVLAAYVVTKPKGVRLLDPIGA